MANSRKWVQHARSPWFVPTLCFGLGAGLAFLGVGVPSLSTEAAAGWFGGFGGWAGAIATFVAVLLPFQRERKRARFRARLTLGSFLKNLDAFRRQLDTLSSVRSTLANSRT
jgi:hypothetical protein